MSELSELGNKAKELVVRNREARLEELLGDSYCVFKSIYRVASFYNANNFPRPEVYSKGLTAQYADEGGIVKSVNWVEVVNDSLEPLGVTIDKIYTYEDNPEKYEITIPQEFEDKVVRVGQDNPNVAIRGPHIVLMEKAGREAHAIGIVKSIYGNWVGNNELKLYSENGYEAICLLEFSKPENKTVA